MKFSRFIAPVLVLTILLTGCSLLPLSADEQKYVDNCQIVYGNYQEYVKLLTKFYHAKFRDPEYDWQFNTGSTEVTIVGEASRDLTSAAIERQFPWIKELVDNYFKDISKKDFLEKDPGEFIEGDLEYLAVEAFFVKMAIGTNFEIKKLDLKEVSDEYHYPRIGRVFAKFSPSERFKNCDEAIGLDESSSMETQWDHYNLEGNSGVALFSVIDVSIGLWGCNKFGVGFVSYGKGWDRCAGSDFDLSSIASTGSNVITEEERAILAEREADAEREAQNPSSSVETSNVTPGQICTQWGSVVQTDSYGQLTCKIVWLNKIKALVWMRS